MLKKSIIFDQSSMRILWFEALLFSVVFGLAYRSWIVPVVLLVVLFSLLRVKDKAIYAIAILSLLWGLIFAGIAFEEVGWGWSLVIGGLVFYKGLNIHCKKLNPITSAMNISLTRNHDLYMGRFNLN